MPITRTGFVLTLTIIAYTVALALQITYLVLGSNGYPIVRAMPSFVYAFTLLCFVTFRTTAWRIAPGNLNVPNIIGAVAFTIYGIGDAVLEIPGSAAFYIGVGIFVAGHLVQINSIITTPSISNTKPSDTAKYIAWTVALCSMCASVVLMTIAVVFATRTLDAIIAIGVACYILLIGAIPVAGIIHASGSLYGTFYLLAGHCMQVADVVIVAAGGVTTTHASDVIVLVLYSLGYAFVMGAHVVNNIAVAKYKSVTVVKN